MLRALVDAVGAVSLWVPMLTTTVITFVTTGNYSHFSGFALWLPSSFVGVAWKFALCSYRLQWANPLWGLLRFDEAAQLEQIAQLAVRGIAAVGGEAWATNHFNASRFADLPIFTISWFQ